MPKETDRLEWPDGRSIELPDKTYERTALWAARFTHWIRECDPSPEMIERAFQGILDEERRVTLLQVEQHLQKLF